MTRNQPQLTAAQWDLVITHYETTRKYALSVAYRSKVLARVCPGERDEIAADAALDGLMQCAARYTVADAKTWPTYARCRARGEVLEVARRRMSRLITLQVAAPVLAGRPVPPAGPDAFAELVAPLPTDARELLTLIFVTGESCRNLAAARDVPLFRVAAARRKALRKLRYRLETCGDLAC